MDKTTNLKIWNMRILFVLLFLLIIFIELLPVSLLPQSTSAPNIMVIAALVLVMRKPQYLPFWLVGLTFLFSDFLLSKPLGMETFLILLSTQFVRRNHHWFHEMNFVLEWAIIALVLLTMVLVRELMFILTLSEGSSFFSWLRDLTLTILTYPLIVGCVNILFQAWKSDDNPITVLGRSA